MPSAGSLRERIVFQSRDTEAADDLGNTRTVWADRFERRAMFIMRPGSEAVTAARLEGRQPVNIVVRFDRQTSQVTPEWRVKDARSGKTYSVLTAEDMERTRMWWSMMCEAGTAE